ncbi:MAG: alpha/beta fold hydrolase [Deltaproteobacteria bacterium]|nr:MAG: alpha/beta fold hydrolase [Deltaproteobacteria bacterium]
MPKATLDDIQLHYDVAGSGTPVLLIMGLSVPGTAWRFQSAALSQRHRVAWFDNRGVGQSDAPPPPYTMAGLAADACGLMDHLGWQDAHVVGISMGGMVAQHLALDHRARVRTLTLIATSAGGALARIPKAAGAWHFLRAMLGPRRGRIDATARLLFPPAFRKREEMTRIYEILREDFGTRPPEAGRKGQLRAVFAHDTRRRLGELAGLPTLVIKPEADVLVRPTENERLHASIPGSTILRLPGAGHGLLRQVPDAINAALLSHFAAADAARAPALAPA